ncbi:hypothetical protein [Salinibacterium sp. SWN248]|uniref:hypothetical protein n=1 Tax=Salinibacterium sp. SWN248 TaxID=2792056 RepID=UPI0018CE9AAA|nr:hypothetical protein [Salinibacterium sp. SWN248]MBH0023809.1 hypothetical protein [Salinibacterium sp. SWN248]
MINEVDFEVESIFLQACGIQRGPKKPTLQGLGTEVSYGIPNAEFKAGDRMVRITTRMDATISASTDDESEITQSEGGPDATDESEVIGVLFSEHVVTFEASRILGEIDSHDGGTLEAAVERANQELYPYHRQMIEDLSSKLGLPPFRLPPTHDKFFSLGERSGPAPSENRA